MMYVQTENISEISSRGKSLQTQGLSNKEKALNDVKNILHSFKTPVPGSGKTSVFPTPGKSCNTALAKPFITKGVSATFEIFEDDDLGHDHAKCEAVNDEFNLEDFKLPEAVISFYGNSMNLFKPKKFYQENILMALADIELPQNVTTGSIYEEDQFEMNSDLSLIVPPL